MNNDPDIRAQLKRRLDEVNGDPALPHDTALRAKRRGRLARLWVTTGGLASVLLLFFGFQVLGSNEQRTPLPPASTPTSEDFATPRDDGSSTPRSDADDEEETDLEPGNLEAPPPVTITTPDKTIELSAESYCYKTGCVSGGGPRNPPDIGSPEEVIVEFPLSGWTFGANFEPAAEKCGREYQASLQSLGDGRFVLRPVGYAGTYDVSLFGEGNGDLSVSFRWTTPSDGPLPEPRARAAILGGEEGNVDSYGVELSLSNLAETPNEASATITVKAADGDSITFEAQPARGPVCYPEGTLYWDGPDEKGVEAAELAPGPFEYIVEVTLDEERYTGTGTWPTDEIRGNEPSIALDFEPPLPGLD